MPAMSHHFLVLVQQGGTAPAMGGFGYGSGLILLVVVAVIVGFVVLALFRAGGRRR